MQSKFFQLLIVNIMGLVCVNERNSNDGGQMEAMDWKLWLEYCEVAESMWMCI